MNVHDSRGKRLVGRCTSEGDGDTVDEFCLCWVVLWGEESRGGLFEGEEDYGLLAGGDRALSWAVAVAGRERRGRTERERMRGGS